MNMNQHHDSIHGHNNTFLSCLHIRRRGLRVLRFRFRFDLFFYRLSLPTPNPTHDGHCRRRRPLIGPVLSRPTKTTGGVQEPH